MFEDYHFSDNAKIVSEKIPGKKSLECINDKWGQINDKWINGVSHHLLTPFPNTGLHRETSQWIEQKDWTRWDDFTKTVYNYPFEVDPIVSRKRIMDVYRQLIEEGLDYSAYQLIE